MNPHVLITGATGFIGKHLVAELLPHARVRILVRATSNIEPFRGCKDIEIVYGDLDTDRGLDTALNEIDTVIHCAARTIGVNYGEYYQTNTLGTMHLVKAMKRNGIRNILVLSTNAVSGPSVSQQPITETDKLCPISHYGLTKKLAEDIVKKSGLHYTILRPVAVYGPFDMDMLKYINLINQGICPVIGFGEKYLNLIHVHDLVCLMVTCIIRQAYHNQTFFIHDGHCYCFRDVVKTIARLLNKKVRIIRIPKYIALFYSVLNDVFIPPKKRLIRRDKIHELACQYWLCSTKNLKTEYSFKPQYTLARGMQETISWYKENGYLT